MSKSYKELQIHTTDLVLDVWENIITSNIWNGVEVLADWKLQEIIGWRDYVLTAHLHLNM